MSCGEVYVTCMPHLVTGHSPSAFLASAAEPIAPPLQRWTLYTLSLTFNSLGKVYLFDLPQRLQNGFHNDRPLPGPHERACRTPELLGPRCAEGIQGSFYSA